MKPIKTIIALTLLAALAFAPGCATTSTQTPEQREESIANRVQGSVQIAVLLGSSVDMKAHPDRIPAYFAAHVALESLVKSERWDAQAFALALASTGNDVFTSGDATLILTTIPTLFDVLSGGKINLSQVRYLKPAMIGADAGLTGALKSNLK